MEAGVHVAAWEVTAWLFFCGRLVVVGWRGSLLGVWSPGASGAQWFSGASMVGTCQTRRHASTLSVSSGLPGCNALAPRVLRERGVLGVDAVVSQGIAPGRALLA